MPRTAKRSTAGVGDAAGPQLGDAFGALLLACWDMEAQANQVWEFVERDDGLLSAADAARYFAAPADWSPVDIWACQRATGRVLDIGCGAGRHALLLQQAGYDVVALDVSLGAIEVCRRRGVQQPVLGTAFDLRPTNVVPFDTLLLLGHNLGLLQDAQHAQLLLATLAALAAPNAVIIGQSHDPLATVNPLHRAYHQRNRERGRLPGQARIRVRHQHLATEWFDYLFVSVGELEQLLAGSAWTLEHVEETEASYVAVLRHSGQ